MEIENSMRRIARKQELSNIKIRSARLSKAKANSEILLTGVNLRPRKLSRRTSWKNYLAY